MIPWLISLATSRVARAIWKPIAAIFGLLGWSYWQRRQGAQAAAAKRAAEDAAAYRDTIEKVTDETLSDDPADAIRRRMRDRAGKP